tara:strand:- start:1736 stop:2020 length:285 start_codon:yes stop_codon:yes gene_type:complete
LNSLEVFLAQVGTQRPLRIRASRQPNRALAAIRLTKMVRVPLPDHRTLHLRGVTAWRSGRIKRAANLIMPPVSRLPLEVVSLQHSKPRPNSYDT